MTEPAGARCPSSGRWLVATSLLAAVVVLGVGACGGSKPHATATATPGGAAVHITNFTFGPPALTVRAGTTVTWTNQDTAIHSIKDTSPLATPVSQDLAQGGTFSITYGRPGSYSYICGIHNYMTGSVEVTG